MKLNYIANEAWATVAKEIASQWRGITLTHESRAFKSVIVKCNGTRIGRIWEIEGNIYFDNVSTNLFCWDKSKTIYQAIETIVDREIGF